MSGDCVIYELRNIKNGKVFIGSSSNEKTAKKTLINRIVNNDKLYEKISEELVVEYKKSNGCDFCFTVIDRVNRNNQRYELEKYKSTFNSYDPQYGYNNPTHRPTNNYFRKVSQYTLTGEFVKEYRNYSQVNNGFSSVKLALTGEVKKCGEFLWIFSDEVTDDKIKAMVAACAKKKNTWLSSKCISCGKSLQKKWALCPFCGKKIIDEATSDE